MNKHIPNGYKQTEIGIIPEDWEVKKLGEVFDINRGASPRPIDKYITNKKEGINWIKISDINVGDKFLTKTEIRITKEGANQSVYVNPGDLILSNSMSYGRPYISKIFGCIHDGWLLLKKRENININFSYYLLSSNYIKKHFNLIAAGSGVNNLKIESVKEIDIQLPPLPEQQAIARVLSGMDALIEQLNKLIQKKTAIKKGAMEQLLTGQKRLPGFTGKWVKKKLGEVFDLNRGASPRPIDKYITNKKEGINWIKICDIDVGDKYLTKTEIRITKEGANQSVYVNPNDLILSNSMSYGRPYISKIFGCIHDGWLLLKKRENININFSYYLLSSNYIKKYFDLIAAGSGVNNLKIKSVKEIEIKLPPTLKEQQAIAQILSDMDKEIEALENLKRKYENIKKGAMALLLTGKVRLKNIKQQTI